MRFRNRVIITSLFVFTSLVLSQSNKVTAPDIDVKTKETNVLQDKLNLVNIESIGLAIKDMTTDPNFNESEANKNYVRLKQLYAEAEDAIISDDNNAEQLVTEAIQLKRKILLNKTVLNFNELLVINQKLKTARQDMAPQLGTEKANWKNIISSDRKGFDAEIQLLSNLTGDIEYETIYKGADSSSINTVSLHWDADRIMFTAPDKNDKWQIFEIKTDGSDLNQITQLDEPDLEFFDGTYLPNGKIVAVSNIGYNGVPCVNGNDIVGNICLYDPATKNLRRLNFGQDNDWKPVVMNNGRIQYLRWEYTDLTHYFSRIMMHMNPDGTNKRELYGSGSFWPNSTFDAQPLPGEDNTAFVAIVSGHHGVARSGRMVIFDPSRGRKEADGVIQEIPYRNRKVEPLIKDKLVNDVWPQFLTPMPINEKYYLVSAKLTPNSLWGIYLVDVFDNMTLLIENEGEGYLRPIPVVKKTVPPVIPENVNLADSLATVYIQDLYIGRGTVGVPRGTIKELRIFAYEYAYMFSPSNHMAQGIESGWDIKRELGTVPVNEDGSVVFKVHANLPFSMQPLDKDGAAIQWMRSWTTGMPGEVISCVGCHEDQNTIARPKFTTSSTQTPREIDAPEDGIRSFTFAGEVQPILDRRCIGCHDGNNKLPNFADRSLDRKMSVSYLELHPYVRRQGAEADIYTMNPMEYHVNTSVLIKKLRTGHHNVVLDDDEWKVLYKWIDFNAPYHGTFVASDEVICNQIERRQQLSEKYSNIKVDWEKEIEDYMTKLDAKGPIETITPKKSNETNRIETNQINWVFEKELFKNSEEDEKPDSLFIKITDSLTIKMVKIPKGKYKRKDGNQTNELKSFWMAECEITNEQYQSFFPEHDSRFINQFWKDHVNAGYPANLPDQPVIRISYDQAIQFCEKLSKKSGLKIKLPSVEQWEWAARSGSKNDFFFGSKRANFSAFANLADASLCDMAVVGVDPQPMAKDHLLRPYFDFVPRSATVDDGNMVVAPVKQYQPNKFGLYDMVGNVAEWTSSSYFYPTTENEMVPYRTTDEMKVVKGFSWRDNVEIAELNKQEIYLPWQRVYNVGFRIIIEE